MRPIFGFSSSAARLRMGDVNSAETIVAVASICAFEAGRSELRQLIGRRSLRRRLAVSAGEQLPARRPSEPIVIARARQPRHMSLAAG
jgi:hypothetical protein